MKFLIIIGVFLLPVFLLSKEVVNKGNSLEILSPFEDILVKIESQYDKEDLEKYVKKLEKNIKIPKGMLHTLIVMESNYQHKAINPKDPNRGVAVTSYGLGQLTEDTAWDVCGLFKDELYDPFKNIECSAKLVKYQLNRYKKDISYAVAAYNAGTPCVCDGVYYKRPMWDYKLKKTVEGICYVDASFTDHVVFGSRKKMRNPVEAKCGIFEIGKFLNQEYVDKFYSLWNGKDIKYL